MKIDFCDVAIIDDPERDPTVPDKLTQPCAGLRVVIIVIVHCSREKGVPKLRQVFCCRVFEA